MQDFVGLLDDEYTEGTERKPFAVTDDDSAEWVLSKIKGLRADTEKWTTFYSDQREKICDQNERSESYLTGLLSAYFTKVPKKETKTQAKYALPSGTLVRKKQQPSFEKDDKALTAFLSDSGMNEYLATVATTTPKWADLKKQCITQSDGSLVEKSTGLVLKGVKAVARPDKFEVNIS